MASHLTMVRLDCPAFGAPLQLARVPKYLRFVAKRGCGGRYEWDALDQLDDVPEADEEIVAAVLAHFGSVHLDRVVKGKRVGEWHRTADYEYCDEQPPDEVLRSTERWREWVLNQQGANREG